MTCLLLISRVLVLQLVSPVAHFINLDLHHCRLMAQLRKKQRRLGILRSVLSFRVAYRLHWRTNGFAREAAGLKNCYSYSLLEL
ncbi:hypothetical protein CEXT_301211 [Caerostris extrusa]|uniref:Secreted protein n=1 Tax=Caerostris extrusa TaxID=172846 RepID=A0AAV4U997_CAEEX|nr:hypothetical protein CEXT_301211 [Caerostris extrusa]